jgi:hypothetical protein
MNTIKVIWLVILIPLMLMYAINEIRRGWNIIKYNQKSLNFALLLRVKLIEIFRGKDFANQFQERLLSDTKEMKSLAFNSIFGGILLLLVVVGWIIILYKKFVH